MVQMLRISINIDIIDININTNICAVCTVQAVLHSTVLVLYVILLIRIRPSLSPLFFTTFPIQLTLYTLSLSLPHTLPLPSLPY